VPESSAPCRYCYKGQIQAAHWNVAQLASALLAADLIEHDAAQEAVNAFPEQVLKLMNNGFAAKIGLKEYDEAVVTELLQLMYDSKADFTNTFRALCGLSHEREVAEVPPSVLAALGEELSAEQSEVRLLAQQCVQRHGALWCVAFSSQWSVRRCHFFVPGSLSRGGKGSLMAVWAVTSQGTPRVEVALGHMCAAPFHR
jgi:uncharacterized protein YdiU (UPF0061 family)